MKLLQKLNMADAMFALTNNQAVQDDTSIFELAPTMNKAEINGRFCDKQCHTLRKLCFILGCA